MPSSRLPAIAFLTAAIVITLAILASRAGDTEAGDLFQGDANCDAEITGPDAVAILLAAADLPSTDCADAAGDINCDSAVDEADVLALLLFLGGIDGSGAAGATCPGIGGPLPAQTPGPSTTVSPTTEISEAPTTSLEPSPSSGPPSRCETAAGGLGLGPGTPTVTATATATSTSTPTSSPTASPALSGIYSLEEVIAARDLRDAAENKVELAMIPGVPNQAVLALQTGEICRVSLTGAFAPQPWGDIRDLVTFDNNEQGLLSVAFSPGFQQNGQVFIYYTPGAHLPIPDRNTVLARFQATTTNLIEASRQVVITIEEIDKRHQGGHIIFDQSGYLLLSLGDGGFSGDHLEVAQELDRLLGKVIRIDVSQLPYSIPPSNPFINTANALPEIYALGFRNPWRMTMDQLTGDIWLADVGEASWEEVDQVIAGGNYGWDCYEGHAPWEATSTPLPEDDQCTGKTFQTPRAVYAHNLGIAVVGGYVYRGDDIPELYGWYVYADWATGRVWALNTEDDSDPVLLIDGGVMISTFAELPDGELLAVSYNDGIFKLVAD